ncbi:hypothetical protein APHAL10511_004683 [Amanita phalloides]|nr:hypothetical protein APHAL10511_004683 [Amanita phalloides]
MDRHTQSSTSYAHDRISSSSIPYHHSQRTRDVLRTVMKSRKCWKSLKDGEVVWPLELEAALLEGLQNYVPEDTRETRILGRFPMRNRFISDYIYQKTGKRRTAKQVGSRIQQLRDTCGNEQVLKLLRPYPIHPKTRRLSSPGPQRDMSILSSLRHDVDTWSDTSSVRSPSEAPSSDGENQDSTLNVVYIDLVPENRGPLKGDLSGNWNTSSCLTDQLQAVNHVQISQQPRHIRNIDPTVTLVSRNLVEANSVVAVRMEDQIVFSEVTTLELAGPADIGEVNGAKLYRTKLVPGYWEIISNCADPTRYTIEQKVYRHTCAEPAPLLFSAVYKFRFSQAQQTAHVPQPHPYASPAEISQGIAINGSPVTCQHPHLSTDYPLFDLVAPFDNLLGFDDDILSEFESLRTQSPYRWETNSSNSSFVSTSVASPSHISVSPASPRLSITPPNVTTSSTLYAMPSVHYSAPELDAFQNTFPDNARLCSTSELLPHDLYDIPSFVLDATCDIQNP